MNYWSKAILVLLAAALCLPACTEQGPTSAVETSWSDAAQFPLSVPNLSRPSIDAGNAAVLAAAWARTYGSEYKERYQHVLGEEPNFAGATVGRLFFAESSYEPLDPALSTPYHKRYGPYYVLPLLDRGKVVSLIGISAFATDLSVVDGRIKRPKVAGAEFFHRPPTASQSAGFLTPEAAVRIIQNATGVASNQPPILLLRPLPYSPVTAMWRVSLTRTMTVTDEAGAEAPVTDLFVSPSGDIYRGLRTGANDEEFTYRSPGTGEAVKMRVSFKADTPNSYRRVLKIGGGQ